MKQNGDVSLDEVLRQRFVVYKGKRIPVNPLDGVGYELMQKMEASTTPEAQAANCFLMYDIAKRCVDPGQLDVMTLTAEQVGTLVGVAAKAVNSVENSVPKSRTAGKKGAASP